MTATVTIPVVRCGRQRRDLEHRVERVAGIDRLQKFRRLLDKGEQRIADRMGKGAGAGGGKAENLKAMCKRRRMAALAAIFDIVMDRVIIRRDRLKRGEMRLGHRAAWDVETLADREILEIPALRKAVLPRVRNSSVMPPSL